MHDNGCVDVKIACDVAVQNGSLATLKLLHSLSFAWDDVVPALAATVGQVDIIQWARDRGCPWSERSCQYVTYHGQFETLKWLCANGCPWDELTTTNAKDRRNI